MQLLIEDDVALRNDEKEWVLEAIKGAIADLNPRGWRRWVRFFREIGPIIGTLSFILALMALVATAAIFASSRLREEAEFRGKTSERLNASERRLDGIDAALNKINAQLSAIRLSQSAHDPTNPAKAVEARQLLETAQLHNIQIPKTAVQDAGKAFFDVSKLRPDLWSTTVAFINYASFITSPPWGLISPPRKPFHTRYNIGTTPSQRGQLFAIGETEGPIFPDYRPLSKPSENHGGPTPQFLLLENASPVLDGYLARRVVFLNSHIIYRGGPVQLEDVYFVNCTFDIQQNAPERRFAQVMLTYISPVNFRNG